jgi:hypothetical protein
VIPVGNTRSEMVNCMNPTDNNHFYYLREFTLSILDKVYKMYFILYYRYFFICIYMLLCLYFPYLHSVIIFYLFLIYLLGIKYESI